MKQDFGAQIAKDPVGAFREAYKGMTYFTEMQRAIVEAKAKELFQDYLPQGGISSLGRLTGNSSDHD
jgi:hypothetical protein